MSSSNSSATAVSDPILTSGTLPRRRNGKAFSCETCRRAKAACDHTLPQCSRCVRRGIGATCTYHPAPMTRVRTPPTPTDIVPKRTKTGRILITPAHNEPEADPKDGSLSAAASLLFLVSQNTGSIDDGDNCDFVGQTSYAAILRENENRMQDVGVDVPCASAPIMRPDYFARERIHLGWRILNHLPDENSCWQFMKQASDYADCTVNKKTTRILLSMFWATWRSCLESRRPDAMEGMARRIWQNEKESRQSVSSTEEWLASYSGAKLRWETVGLLFAVFGSAIATLPDWSGLIKDKCPKVFDRMGWAAKMCECAKGCLLFCEESGILNDIVLWLMLNVAALESLVQGDDARNNWVNYGRMASALKAYGLHQGPDVPGPCPSFSVSQQRKQLYCSAYIFDKTIATCYGRPPELSSRYSHCEMPLELTDDELDLEGDALAQALAQLDSDGWNQTLVATRDKTLPNVTPMRAWTIAATVREEILELSLGPPARYSDKRRDELLIRSDEAYQRLPKRLHFVPGTHKTKSPDCLVTQLTLGNEFLLNKLLLERLPGGNNGIINKNIFETAKVLLDRVVLIHKERDRLADHAWTFSWHVVYFGIPCASLLAVELLSQHQHSNRSAHPLPRSEVIQNLSVFIACLDTVRTSEGNYQLCSRVRKVISKILDKVLEPPPLTTPDLLAIPLPVDQALLDVDMSSFMGPTEDLEFMQWLEGVDWTKGPLLEGFQPVT